MDHKHLFSKLLIIFIIMGSLISQPLSAQYKKYKIGQEEDQNSHFSYNPYTLTKYNPVPLIINDIPMASEIRLSLETSFIKNHSLSLGYGIIRNNFILSEPLLDNLYNIMDDVKSGKGYRIFGSYRYYIAKDYGPSGMYSSPCVSYAAMSFKKPNGKTIDITHRSITLIIGKQGKIMNNIYLDIFAGIGLKDNKNTEYPEDYSWLFKKPSFIEENTYNHYFKVMLGANIGIRIY
ncbi:MAG: hypothetical protein K9H84_06885 [Bacteroidales bacterium]|nr:hypothetical protein [Bacteroidales bacterium]